MSHGPAESSVASDMSRMQRLRNAYEHLKMRLTEGKITNMEIAVFAAATFVLGVGAVSALLKAFDHSKKRKIKRQIRATRKIIKLVTTTPPGTLKRYDLNERDHRNVFKKAGWKKVEKLVREVKKDLVPPGTEMVYIPNRRELIVKNSSVATGDTGVLSAVQERFWSLLGLLMNARGRQSKVNTKSNSKKLNATATSTTTNASEAMVVSIFSHVKDALKSDPTLGKAVGGTIRFVLGDKTWTINGKENSVTQSDAGKADCTITMSMDDFVSLITGQLNAASAFMTGRIKIKGDKKPLNKFQKHIKSNAVLKQKFKSFVAAAKNATTAATH